jgi:hypothetical protein
MPEVTRTSLAASILLAPASGEHSNEIRWADPTSERPLPVGDPIS